MCTGTLVRIQLQKRRTRWGHYLLGRVTRGAAETTQSHTVEEGNNNGALGGVLGSRPELVAIYLDSGLILPPRGKEQGQRG